MMEKIQHNQPDRVPPSALEIENVRNHTETSNETVSETFAFFRDLLESQGFKEYKNMNEAYRNFPSEKIIVRREDPRNILILLSEGGSYEVDFVGDHRYSNCVEWNPQTDGPKNISNAYLEGFTNMNSVVTVIGVERQDKDDIVQLKDATQDFYGLQRQGVRSFTGTITKEHVLFINLRVPGHLLPESELTDDELDRVDQFNEARDSGKKAIPVMIHRSYLHNSDQSEQELEKAA